MQALSNTTTEVAWSYPLPGALLPNRIIAFTDLYSKDGNS
jgi:hypothetical protein